MKRTLESANRRGLFSRLASRSPDSAIFGQGVRFALVGGSVTVIYLLTTLLLANVVSLPFQVALPIGYCLGLLTHFTLQRVFVWVHHEEFALPLHHQAGRYLAVAGVQYGLTAASTAVLPSALGLPTEPVYVVTVLVLVCMNFFVFRHRIFHAKLAVVTEATQTGATQTDVGTGALQ